MRHLLWHHPLAIALLVALIGFAGELVFYTSEEGAALLFGLAAGVVAYLAVQVLRHTHAFHRSGHAGSASPRTP